MKSPAISFSFMQTYYGFMTMDLVLQFFQKDLAMLHRPSMRNISGIAAQCPCWSSVDSALVKSKAGIDISD